MVVAVFGASGKFGRFVVEDLRGHGYHVVGFDRAAGDGVVAIDMRDYGQVAEAIQGVDERHGGVDAVVHLAAIPAPGLATDATTFHNNVPATYNVFKAAAAAGVRNVVWTSSETTLGLPMGPDNPPPYLPVDEDVLRPETTYALGKHLEEAMAEQFARWHHGMKLIGLRLSNVMRPEDYAAFDGWQDDPLTRIWNVWGYIDGRDGGPGGAARAGVGDHGFRAVHHRQLRHRHARPQRRTRRPLPPRRAADPRDRRARDAAQHREGPAPARLRACPQPLRPALTRGTT